MAEKENSIAKMTVFSEKQRFTQWWLWTILIAVLATPVIITLNDPKLGYKAHTASDIAIGASVPVLVLVLFLVLQLRTRVDESGVYYRFVPIHFQVLRIGWEEIDRIFIRQYRPLAEYGGWGIRLGIGGKGKAYNVKGNMGLQIVLKTGKRILIGTQNPDELQQFLDGLVKNTIISRQTIQPETKA